MELWDFTGNVALATLLGAVIGLERELNRHPAGLRTNALVALGAALFVSLTALMGDTSSPTRIAAYIVSGVGFLGGGAILKEGANVRGLTTAAGLWCSAAVGTLCGTGHGLHAAVGCAFVLLLLLVLRPVSHWLERVGKRANTAPANYVIKVVCRGPDHAVVRTVLARHLGGVSGLVVTGVSTSKPKRRKLVLVTADATATPANDRAIQEAVARLLIEPGVRSASWERVAQLPE